MLQTLDVLVCETDDVVKQTTNDDKDITYDYCPHVPTPNCPIVISIKPEAEVYLFIFTKASLFLDFMWRKLVADYRRFVNTYRRLQSKCDGTKWRTGGEVNGKSANGVCSQDPSHYLGTCCIQHYYCWCAHLGCYSRLNWRPRADLNRLVRFAERRNLVCVRVPSHFNWPLPSLMVKQ